MSSKITKCKVCGADIAKGAKACPSCGKDSRNFFVKHKIISAILILLLLGAVGGALAGGDDSDLSAKNDNQTNAKTITDQASTSSIDKTASPEDNVPAEYKSALRKATSYANSMDMSKIGVYDQLTSEYGEQFSQEAAQYGIDNVKTDWKANALAKAKSYADSMNMSKASIYDQLISEAGEQFTQEEAQYAIDNVIADWKANALAKAKSYQESMAMSPASIREQLVSENGEKFTAEEADYAIQHLND